jgi:hypothetical protein
MRQGSSGRRTSKHERSIAARSGLDDLHDRIQSKLDELHADFKQLEVDVHTANQASSRATGSNRGIQAGIAGYSTGCRPRRKGVELKVKCYCRSALLALTTIRNTLEGR